ncbi:MAG: group II truncated hemoglobin [Phycisphaerales bacterium]|nr:group II truncated hemoglobin [Phycisphaerales bacterium]
MTLEPTINAPFNAANPPYDAIGGDAGVRGLVDAFYDRVAHDPLMRAMHKPDLTEAREKLFEFLSGWLGGPQLYIERHGHPRLRMRHMPFPIDDAAVEAWLACMHGAMKDRQITGPLYSFLSSRFTHTANFMRNR